MAELGFAAQLALLLYALGEASESAAVVYGSTAPVPLVAMAQLCCWYGVATRRSVGEFCEESLWTIMGVIVFACFIRLGSLTGFGPTVSVGVLGTVAYLSFMLFSGLPMYAKRWRYERAHPDHLGLIRGLRDMAARRVPTGRWEDWRAEVAWMSLYFSLCVWLSIAMAVIAPS